MVLRKGGLGGSDGWGLGVKRQRWVGVERKVKRGHLPATVLFGEHSCHSACEVIRLQFPPRHGREKDDALG